MNYWQLIKRKNRSNIETNQLVKSDSIPQDIFIDNEIINLYDDDAKVE